MGRIRLERHPIEPVRLRAVRGQGDGAIRPGRNLLAGPPGYRVLRARLLRDLERALPEVLLRRRRPSGPLREARQGNRNCRQGGQSESEVPARRRADAGGRQAAHYIDDMYAAVPISTPTSMRSPSTPTAVAQHRTAAAAVGGSRESPTSARPSSTMAPRASRCGSPRSAGPPVRETLATAPRSEIRRHTSPRCSPC